MNKEHIHKYLKVILGGRRVVRRDGKRFIEKCSGYEVFKCVVPGCNHFISSELILGRIGQCWKCNENLTLSPENTKLKKPTHIWCRKTREKKENAA